MDIRELREISAFIGNQRNLVQGPGGNTSFKNQERIFVKASGTRLDEALNQDIFAEIDLLTGENYTPSLRPSIELGLHSELPFTVVIHVHSLGSLAWGLRQRDKDEDSSLSRIGLLLAPYLRPGDEITTYLRNIEANAFKGILLQNHGLITWGDDCESALNRLITLESNLVSLARDTVKNTTAVHSIESIPMDMKLTPDHAVFSNAESRDQVELEILQALEDALSLIPKNVGITFIESEESSKLQNWEAEKYRRGLNSP